MYSQNTFRDQNLCQIEEIIKSDKIIKNSTAPFFLEWEIDLTIFLRRHLIPLFWKGRPKRTLSERKKIASES